MYQVFGTNHFVFIIFYSPTFIIVIILSYFEKEETEAQKIEPPPWSLKLLSRHRIQDSGLSSSKDCTFSISIYAVIGKIIQ